MFPAVSVDIPTLNAENTIGRCLESIFLQDYPKDKIEIVIADGGSIDRTIEIIKSISADYNSGVSLKILDNPLRTGEAGKAVCTKASSGEIIAFIDSDNILPSQGWMRRMVEPFSDGEIIASEPLEYTYRKSDGYVTRYSALLGMNDPLCLFLGNYDRRSTLTGRWTDMPRKEEDKGDYLKIELNGKHMPTIGANGFFIRKNVLDKCKMENYLFDIDLLYELSSMGYKLKVAKVKVGIIHIFAGGLSRFIHKQTRRVRDYQYYKKLGLRRYKWGGMRVAGAIKFTFYSILVFPLVLQAIRSYAKKRDAAWFFHIPACVITLFIYAASSVESLFISRPLSRKKW
ncbi:MAG: glycosyltransferase family 2 protein [Candidatus Omnitrophica bacterium]|nr:glycosyltransferase family 2 protein [Candidatus Omnitrophota bacterium]